MSGDALITSPADPGDIRTFPLDYSALLAQLGDNLAIDLSEWEEIPSELIQVGTPDSGTNWTSITVDLANAVIGRNYTLYNRITISNGEKRRRAMTIPVRDSATFRQASDAKTTLDAIRAAMAKTATRAQLRRTIGDKSIEFMSITELIVAETKFQQLYNQERRNEKIRQGAPFLKNVHTRFNRSF